MSLHREAVRELIAQIGIIPSIRLSSPEDALFAAEAISSSGIPIIEVTLTVPGALHVIAELVRNNPELAVGAGTVRDIESAKRCLDAGAKFLTTPYLDLEIVDYARKQDIVVFPGALTPTEIVTAWKAGSDFVKIFPSATLPFAHMAGPGYIKALKSPFPDIPLIASGGVTQQTAGEFIRAGAVAIGVGRDLIQPNAITRRERNWIVELSRRFLAIVHDARSEA